MHDFIQAHAGVVTGALTGFDRLVLRGQLPISYADAMDKCLGVEGVLLKEFGEFAASKTKALVAGTERFAETRGRPVVYLPSPKIDKEETARAIAMREGVEKGLICVFKCVEPCWRFDIKKDPRTGHIRVVAEDGKCAFYYHYAFHPVFGWMNARIQTYLPFTIQLCLNGREWLARQMDAAGIMYEKHDNTFARVQDLQRAQELLDSQATIDWVSELEGVARCLLPDYPRVFTRFEVKYSWTVHQSEVATDVMFKDDATLPRLYPPMTRHAITAFGAEDVIRFLGQNRAGRNGVRRNFAGDVTSDYKRRPEGTRVKHFVNKNSIKIYDKADGHVLRVETTINEPREFKVFRPAQGGDPTDVTRRYLRRSIEDMARRLHLCREANGRYLDKFATFSCPETLHELTGPLTRPARMNKSRVRGLRPHDAGDLALLAAINRGEFAVNGFRNGDVRRLLFSEATTEDERRRQAGNVTRRLRLLRAHGIVERVAGSHRYQLTPNGRKIATAILLASRAAVMKLTEAA